MRPGVAVLSPDGSKLLYSALYKDPEFSSIASAVPVSSGTYLENVAFNSSGRAQKKGIQRLQWPP
ncbi:hypothetical protein SAMN05421882_100391 [Nitrosomonas communis]|uniref:Uncharacterized protein n=1 Tax=Nitrosomonas communis TaxID=44574 RepID=A0A1H2R0Y8_9PROT|nr:hypothetical protein SAMN05421882_100391 [Nitrosomonas communis]